MLPTFPEKKGEKLDLDLAVRFAMRMKVGRYNRSRTVKNCFIIFPIILESQFVKLIILF